MDVTFSSAALAALCNSKHRLTQRWGPEVGRTVARRLLDLAAVDVATVERLPGVRVSSNGTSEITVTFEETIVIYGVVSNSVEDSGATRPDADCIVITGLDVHGKDRR